MHYSTVLALVALTALASAQAPPGESCNQGKKCSTKEAPCCSQYGTCGSGAYCLGGCDPRSSFALNACVPNPVCQSKTYTFENDDRLMTNYKYLGDASQTDWVVEGNQAAIYNDNVLLTMPADSSGTVLASSTYMWYGNVKARMKTSRGAGVVTAFILMSDVKDEIDYEWVGADLGTAQTNYYFQGITSYVNSANITLSDTFANYHDYEIQWTPDEINWLVDGQIGRTKKRSDTWNETANQWDFPQTPARIQISVWPGGSDKNAPGTIQWAGGPIDWSSQLMQPQGYYYATIQSVDVSCYQTSSPPGTNKGPAYTYKNYIGTNDTVNDGDNITILSSLQASNLDPEQGKSSVSSSKGSQPTNQNTVPGRTGSPSGADDHSGTDTSASSTTSNSPSSNSNSNANSGGGFNQGTDSGQQSRAGKSTGEERVLKGSMFAGIIAGVALLAL